MHDPWRESDPKWERPSTSIECALIPNVRDYLHNVRPAVTKAEPIDLPPGVSLNPLSDGTWVLLRPEGSRGYVRYVGSKEELLQFAGTFTTTE
jgi:hypothetical protein